MTAMNCPTCDASVVSGDRFCESCGTLLLAAEQVAQGCPKCGAETAQIDGQGYCNQCGFRRPPEPEPPFQVNISPRLAGVSDVGLRHAHNEDFLALQTIGDSHILVVCDGVSSSQTPELAAQAAAQTMCAELALAIANRHPPDQAMHWAIAAGLAEVSAIPHAVGTEDPPSTTVVAAIVQEHTATIGWLGDSRAYWLSPQTCQQLTQDDSWLNQMVTTGAMTEAEAQLAPQAHAITRWLGADMPRDEAASIATISLSQPGFLLLCTDGLWNYTPDPMHLMQLIQQKTDTDALVIAQHLVNFARSQGGHDNISVGILVL